MVHRPTGTHTFEFVVVSMLRAAQLINGCVPRVADAADKPVTTAQREVAAGFVKAAPRELS
mgnify:CR=1 FL=1